MKKVIKLLLFISAISFLLLFNPESVNAIITVKSSPIPIYSTSTKILFTFSPSQGDKGFLPGDYEFAVWRADADSNDITKASFVIPLLQPRSDGIIVVSIDLKDVKSGLTTPGLWKYKIWQEDYYQSIRSPIFPGNYYVNQGENDLPSLKMDFSKFRPNVDASLYVLNVQPNRDYTIWFEGPTPVRPLFSGRFTADQIIPLPDTSLKAQNQTQIKINVGDPAVKTICLAQSPLIGSARTTQGLICETKLGPISVSEEFQIPMSGGSINSVSGDPAVIPPTPTPFVPTPICAKWAITPILESVNSTKVIGYTCSAVDTGLGIDIKTNPVDLVKSVFGVILSLSGGIALILIIISGYGLIFSQGNPEAVKAAQERLTSAVVGLLFIIFSLVILQIIGADILKIPGFSK